MGGMVLRKLRTQLPLSTSGHRRSTALPNKGMKRRALSILDARSSSPVLGRPRAGAMGQGMTVGSIFAINVSNGGVPKRPQQSAVIRLNGLEGDRQGDLRYHGGPDRAVVVYSLELIHALQSEGHPITPGSIGENLTISGLDWEGLRPGIRLGISGVVLEITKPASPCRKLTASFAGGQFDRVSDKSHPGWSRLCARVVHEDTVKVNDEVVVL